ncbi:xanthine dehydrogenase small subunit [Comamonadaceae bacterium PP-2]
MTSASTPAPTPSCTPITFVRRGELVTLHDVPPDRTLLDLLREDLGCSGTKEGCGEGDCGACTVVLAEIDGGSPDTAASSAAGLKYRAINSCIRLAHSINGMALWTVEDIAADQPGFVFPDETGAAPAPVSAPSAALADLHPVQQAMVQCHGSQCGFCTPGFVMSLFGMYQAHACKDKASPGGRCGQPAITRGEAQAALSGNLCRCTGYRPILDAAQSMQAMPRQWVDEAAVVARLDEAAQIIGRPGSAGEAYLRPTTLPQLLAWRAARPQAQLVAGCTDVGLWVTKQHRRFTQVLDVTAVRELQAVAESADGRWLEIGAAARLADAFDHLARRWPELTTFTRRFAGLPVRNSGTLGGNVANGSPIGDSMPLLIALGAQVVLAGVRGERELPLESLYTGYRQNVMAPDEVLARIRVPLADPAAAEQAGWLRVYKVSKRYDDDISAVCLALSIRLDAHGQVAGASIGAGGVAATPVRARQTEARLLGQPWNAATVQAAMAALRAEFQPISDMRASGAYRRALLGNLLWRYWLESQAPAGTSPIRLEDPDTICPGVSA